MGEEGRMRDGGWKVPEPCKLRRHVTGGCAGLSAGNVTEGEVKQEGATGINTQLGQRNRGDYTH